MQLSISQELRGSNVFPSSFMQEKMILVPPLAEQRQIVAELDALQGF